MRANQREEVRMVADLILRSAPTLGVVALRAIRAKLPQMNIGMAIGAIPADIGKDRLRVTLRACHFLMSTGEGELGSIVVEIGIAANRAPAGSRMAIFARNLQRPVWVRSCTLLGVNSRRMAQKQ